MAVFYFYFSKYRLGEERVGSFFSKDIRGGTCWVICVCLDYGDIGGE